VSRGRGKTGVYERIGVYIMLCIDKWYNIYYTKDKNKKVGMCRVMSIKEEKIEIVGDIYERREQV